MHLASFQPNTDAFNNCTTGSQNAFEQKVPAQLDTFRLSFPLACNAFLIQTDVKKTAFQLQYRLAEIHSHQCWGYIQHL